MKTLAYVMTAVGALTASAVLNTAFAAGPVAGETSTCIPLGQIASSPIIDDKTILVKMRGTGGFRRLDLVGACNGISYSGYARSSPESRLCTSDSLQVIGPVPGFCKIDKIVMIDEAEADALSAKK